MSLHKVLKNDDPLLAGNWYSFPPPEAGFYDFRKVESTPAGLRQFQYYDNRRVYEGVKNRLLSMGVRVSKMSAGDGWQFRFHQQLINGVPTNWRPMAVIYDAPIHQHVANYAIAPRVVEKRDISGQLPFAHSIQEARHIVRLIPERWPIFRCLHIEYTEEKLQS